MLTNETNPILAAPLFSPIDRAFARLMTRLAGTDAPELMLASALASNWTGNGHVCLDLARVANLALAMDQEGIPAAFPIPPLADWRRALENLPVIGKPGEYRPLILDDKGRLYLCRYWQYENDLAQELLRRAGQDYPIPDPALFAEGLDRLFAREDGQRRAASVAMARNLCLITGGPGTGKTTTVAKILALLLEQVGGNPLRIALAAPTGKAAARLQESIREVKASLSCPPSVREAIPEQAATIHRLLGTIPGSPYFRHNRENPLRINVLVVDEASMVDLPLMVKLVEAIPRSARLILLGDKDQLASVEAGAVLGDLCASASAGQDIPQQPALAGCIAPLTTNFRFGAESGIGALCEAVCAGESGRALLLLEQGRFKDISWSDLTAGKTLLADHLCAGYSNYLATDDPRETLHRLNQFRVLCALRKGPFGVEAINRMVEEGLAKKGLISPTGPWYHGRPIMVTANDYELLLYNGDIGVILADPAAGNQLRAFFPDQAGGLRTVAPARLPRHETVFAMTVHKSQGSEFARVLLLLPDQPAPVLTRELIYTGISRARRRVDLWGEVSVFQDALARVVERSSGLRDALCAVP